MAAPGKTGRRITAELFEIDLSSGEVLRPLREQPFRVLAVFLDHWGKIVSR